MGSMYAWATPDYLLKRMSIEQIFMYYDHGVEFEKHKSNILVSRIAVGLFGVKEEPKKQVNNRYDDKPDRAAFYKAYGDKIKRPEGSEGD